MNETLWIFIWTSCCRSLAINTISLLNIWVLKEPQITCQMSQNSAKHNTSLRVLDLFIPYISSLHGLWIWTDHPPSRKRRVRTQVDMSCYKYLFHFVHLEVFIFFQYVGKKMNCYVCINPYPIYNWYPCMVYLATCTIRNLNIDLCKNTIPMDPSWRPSS